MAFVPIDINSIKLDQVPSGYIPIDINSIKLDNISQEPQPDFVRSAYRGVMENVAKPVNEVIGKVTSAALSPITPMAQGTANAIDSTGAGQWLGDKMMNASNAVSNFVAPAINNVKDLANYDPNLAKDFAALSQNAQFAANVPVLKGIGTGLNKVADTVVNSGLETATQKLPSILGDTTSGVSTNLAAANIPQLAKSAVMTPANIAKIGIPSTEELGKLADVHYKIANDYGAMLKPEAMQKGIAKIKSEVAGSTPEEQAFGVNTATDDILKRLDNISNMPVTLKGLDGIDGKIQQALNTAVRNGDNEATSALIKIRNGLRDLSTSASPEDVVNQAGFQAWRNGDEVFSIKSKSRELDNILKEASQTKNPQTAIQTGMRNLAKNIDKYGSKGWTPEEISAINKAAKTGIVTNVLTGLGNKLIAGGAGAVAGGVGGGVMGVPVGVAAAELFTNPMKASAGGLQGAKVSQVQRLLGNRATIQKLMKMSPSDAKAALEEQFQALKGK